MQFINRKLKDVVLVQPKRYEDDRGYFCETFRRELFVEHGIKDEFVQSNESVSQQGTLRGLHFQIPPKSQAKLIQVVDGSIYDVIVDMREDSPTFKLSEAFELSAENGHTLYVPKGFAHGFLALSETVKVLYHVSEYYSPEHESGIAWDDPDLKIEWPKLDVGYIFSPKDMHYGLLKEVI